jgi:3-deoxy-D-manno-octulosonate 8-phosphate phosphatase (KDO 8-P phosphatase)
MSDISYKQLMNSVKAFILDVDGVLTDSSVHVTSSGEMLRTMNIRDGYAMKAAIESGFQVCIISGGSNEGVRIRLQNLGITDVHLGVSDKCQVFEKFCAVNHLDASEILYMGDDIPDYHVMKLAGLAACPQDAAPEIKGLSSYVSHKNGGQGAVRDVIEQVMKVQGKWLEYFNAKYD